MVRRQMLLLCVFLVSTSAVAEDSVDLPLRWKVGDKLHYEIVKTRQRRQDTKITVTGATRTDLEIEVVTVDQEGYLVGWTHGETRFDDPRQAANPVVQQMGRLLKDFHILLQLDSKAVIVGVRNWKELKEKSSAILTTLTEVMKNAGMDTATMEKIKAPVVSMFATRKGIEAMCTREARMFFMVLGGSYSASEPIEYEGKLPNLLGGEPFPSRATFALKKVDRGSGQAIITWTQTLDPEQTQRILEKTLKDMAARLGGQFPQGKNLESLMIEDTAEFVVDLSSGWLDCLTHKRAMRIGEVTQEDILTIVRKREQTPTPK